MKANSSAQVFIDGPNIDMVLGRDLLGRMPRANERPRWDRVRDWCHRQFIAPRLRFVLNGNRFAQGDDALFAFRRALRSMAYCVECPRTDEGDPVDKHIQQELRSMARLIRPCSVAIFSHDHGYAPELESILMLGGTVMIVGFQEEMSPKLRKLRDSGAILIDLEHEVGAFNQRLPRPQLL